MLEISHKYNKIDEMYLFFSEKSVNSLYLTKCKMNMKRLFILLIGFVILSASVHAFEQKEINVWSEKMGKDVPVAVIIPDRYGSEDAYPVIYLLHGFSDNHLKWTQKGVVGGLSDQYGIIFVLPDGGYDSWYFDSKVTPEYQYETFVSSELVEYVDNNYKTIKDRKGRAITGNSMGGHGALFIGIRHQDVYGSIGALSGGVDFRPFEDQWGVGKRIGSKEECSQAWDDNVVVNMTHLLQPGSVNIVLDCGTEDFFYEVNCTLHEKLLTSGIPHDFYTRPGLHNWKYWLNAIKYQVMYFNDCLRR